MDGQPESSEQQSSQEQQWPWYFKIIQKVACVFAGITCSILGVFVCISLSATCILAGVFQVLIGLIVLMFEAPCCCTFMDFIDQIAKFSQARPPWQKAALYCGLPIVPVALCQSVSAILGCATVFLCGFSFVYMALGRKASREEMLAAARQQQYQPVSHDKSGLVNNAQPIDQAPIHTTPSGIV